MAGKTETVKPGKGGGKPKPKGKGKGKDGYYYPGGGIVTIQLSRHCAEELANALIIALSIGPDGKKKKKGKKKKDGKKDSGGGKKDGGGGKKDGGGKKGGGGKKTGTKQYGGRPKPKP